MADDDPIRPDPRFMDQFSWANRHKFQADFIEHARTKVRAERARPVLTVEQLRQWAAKEAMGLAHEEAQIAHHLAREQWAKDFQSWKDRVARMLPEFSREEAMMLALHAPAEGDWAVDLPTILRRMRRRKWS